MSKDNLNLEAQKLDHEEDQILTYMVKQKDQLVMVLTEIHQFVLYVPNYKSESKNKFYCELYI